MQDGQTALHDAAKGGHTSTVQALVAAGVNVNAASRVRQKREERIEIVRENVVGEHRAQRQCLFKLGYALVNTFGAYVCIGWCDSTARSGTPWSELDSGGVGGSRRGRKRC